MEEEKTNLKYERNKNILNKGANMKTIKENFGNIIMSLGEILIGILLLIKPIGFTKGIIIIVGSILIILGIINIIKYVTTDIFQAIKEQSLSAGLIFVTIGLFCVLRTNWFIITFPVLTILYGIMIFIMGLKKVQWSIDLVRLKRKHWFIVGLSAVTSIMFAIIIMNNPFSTTAILWQFTGIILIIESILDVIALVFETKNK